MSDSWRRLAICLAAATVTAEIGYPLVSGPWRDRLTVLIVVIFFAASVTHALASRGPGWTALLVAVTAGGGLLVEAVGVATGVPFGSYSYAGSLGPQAFNVPVVIALAWTMMAYPAHVVAGRLVSGRLAQGLLTGYALACWDVFLDPQMVDAGHWRWDFTDPALPAAPDVPLTNYAGWLAVATAMGLVLMLAAPLARPRDDRVSDRVTDAVPVALYLWTYASSVLAHLAFFGLAGSALWGGIAMGVVAVPLVMSLRSQARFPMASRP